MNGRQVTNIVPAAPQRRQRRKRGIVPKGGRVALTPKERELHAQQLADGRLKSGRCGAYDYYPVNGKQRWRRHAVPSDPCTPAQQRSRARFAAASKAWSEAGLLTEAHRDEWYADGAKRQSRPRLGSSGPLTAQQNYIGRNCTRSQRDSEMLLHPHQRQQKHAKNIELRPELTTELSQYQPITRLTSGTRRVYIVPAPSIRRVARGYARKFKTRQLTSQVSRLQNVTQSTSDRPQTSTRAFPGYLHLSAGARPSRDTAFAIPSPFVAVVRVREGERLRQGIKAAQGHLDATPMRVDSQLIATLKPPQSHPNASLMRLQGSHKAPTKPPRREGRGKKAK